MDIIVDEKEGEGTYFSKEELKMAFDGSLLKIWSWLILFSNDVKTAHWYVKGDKFYSLHDTFQDLYETVSDMADEVAEYAISIGDKIVNPNFLKWDDVGYILPLDEIDIDGKTAVKEIQKRAIMIIDALLNADMLENDIKSKLEDYAATLRKECLYKMSQWLKENRKLNKSRPESKMNEMVMFRHGDLQKDPQNKKKRYHELACYYSGAYPGANWEYVENPGEVTITVFDTPDGIIPPKTAKEWKESIARNDKECEGRIKSNSLELSGFDGIVVNTRILGWQENGHWRFGIDDTNDDFYIVNADSDNVYNAFLEGYPTRDMTEDSTPEEIIEAFNNASGFRRIITQIKLIKE
ncbi:MAG: hypothetical protein HUJ68_01940 [Clostridia bacterium]|nr:hypothetical protein [Clostridia bacterium]